MDKHWLEITNDVMLYYVLVPCDEAEHHVFTSRYCPCNPRVVDQRGYTHYFHMARDHREMDEFLTQRKTA